jgi:hypothetical protein
LRKLLRLNFDNLTMDIFYLLNIQHQVH